MNFKWIGALAMSAMLLTPALGDDDAEPKKKGKRGQGRQNVATQVTKQLEPVGLTGEQVAKIKELGAKATKAMNEIRKEAGITPALTKKRAEVMKSMKDSDKKGKERMAAINEAAGLTDAQVAALTKTLEVRTKFHKDVMALLSDEQKEKVPARMKRGSAGGEKGKARKGAARNKKKVDA